MPKSEIVCKPQGFSPNLKAHRKVSFFVVYRKVRRIMGNCWHADQENNMRPDVNGLPCPFCGYDHGIAVDTESHDLKEDGVVWSARAFCHECGSQSPSTNITTWPDHPLSEERIFIDWENERDVVNFAVKIWNCRK